MIGTINPMIKQNNTSLFLHLVLSLLFLLIIDGTGQDERVTGNKIPAADYAKHENPSRS